MEMGMDCEDFLGFREIALIFDLLIRIDPLNRRHLLPRPRQIPLIRQTNRRDSPDTDILMPFTFSLDIRSQVEPIIQLDFRTSTVGLDQHKEIFEIAFIFLLYAFVECVEIVVPYTLGEGTHFLYYLCYYFMLLF